MSEYKLPSGLPLVLPFPSGADLPHEWVYGTRQDGNAALVAGTLTHDMFYDQVTVNTSGGDVTIETDGWRFFARKVTVTGGNKLILSANGNAGGYGGSSTSGSAGAAGAAAPAIGSGSTAPGQAGVAGVAGKAGRADAGMGATANRGTAPDASISIDGVGKNGGYATWGEIPGFDPDVGGVCGASDSGEGGCTSGYTSQVPAIRHGGTATAYVPAAMGYAAVLHGYASSHGFYHVRTQPGGGCGGGAGCREDGGTGLSGGGGGSGGNGGSGGFMVVGIEEIIGAVEIQAVGGGGGQGGAGSVKSGTPTECGGGGGGSGGNGGNGGTVWVAIGASDTAVVVDVSGGGGGDAGAGAAATGAGAFAGSDGPFGLGGYAGYINVIDVGGTATITQTADDGLDGA